MIGMQCIRHPVARRSLAGCLAMILFAMLGGVALGQETPPPSPSPTPTATTAPVTLDDLTADKLAEWITALEKTQDIDEDLRTKLLESLRRTKSSLEFAAGWAAKADEFEKLRATAPERLKAIRTEREQLPTELPLDVPPDASLEVLRQRLSEAEAELKNLQDAESKLEEERQRRADRRVKTPEEVAAARQRLTEIQSELDAAPPPGEATNLTKARQLRAEARKRSLENELAAYDREILSYDARGDLLTARRDLAVSKRALQQDLVKRIQDMVNERRRVEAQKAAQQAEAAVQEAQQLDPAAEAIAKTNRELASQRSELKLADRIEQSAAQLARTQKRLDDLTSKLEGIQSRIKLVGMTKAMGLLLRELLEDLPNVRELKDRLAVRESSLVEAQTALFELQELRRPLADRSGMVRQAMSSVSAPPDSRARQQIESAIRELLEDRVELLDDFIRDYEKLIENLGELERAETQLLAQTRESAHFIREHILWIRSTSVPTKDQVHDASEALKWLLQPKGWMGIFGRLRMPQLDKYTPTLLAPVFVILLLFKRRLTRGLTNIGEQAQKPSTQTIKPTLEALVLTLLLSAPWPALVSLTASWVALPYNAGEFAHDVSWALQMVAGFLFGLEFLRHLCQSMGLAESHFNITERTCRLLRRQAIVLAVLGAPIIFVVAALEAYRETDYQSSLGRLAFVLGMVALGIVGNRLLRPRVGIVEDFSTASSGWRARGRKLWRPLAIIGPAVLVLLALAGYYYTALQLSFRLLASLGIGATLFVVYGILLRWLLVARRKLAFEQLRKKRSAALAELEAKVVSQDSAEEAASRSEQIKELGEQATPEIDLTAISQQTRDLLRSVLTLSLLGGLWLVWVDVLPALGVLDRVTVWSITDNVTGDVDPITLSNVLFAGLLALITVIAARNVPGLLEITLLQRLPVTPGGRYAATAIARYVIIVIGLVAAFGAVGLGWSKVQWLVAAVSVGLGFGLQEIFANFVSGLIILFERPIRVGDIVTVGGVEGRVTRIQMRATTIRDWDRRELLVPNREFITTQLINWTLSDPVTRVVLPVGIAYGSNIAKARDLLLQVARNNKYVLNDPKPHAIFLKFGDSSLNFELRVFLADRDNWPKLIDQLHTGIDEAFRGAGIEIAFPQTDIHVRTITAPVRVEQSSPSAAAPDRPEM